MKLLKVTYWDITQRTLDKMTDIPDPTLVTEYGIEIKQYDLFIHILKSYNHEKGFDCEVCTIPIGCVKDVELIRELEDITQL